MSEASLLFDRDFAWLAVRGGLTVAPEPFDPLGEWTQGWALWELAPERQRMVAQRTGTLSLRRSAISSRRFRLRLRLEQEMLFGVVRHLDVDLRCRLDATATPVAWQARSGLRRRDQHASPDPLFDLALEGRHERGRVEVGLGGLRHELEVGGALASEWALLEAVQRLQGSCRFTQLCGSMALQPAQELRPLGEAETPYGPLQGFVQVGPGALASTYWRGQSGRLAAVRRGYWAFTWEPPASQESAS